MQNQENEIDVGYQYAPKHIEPQPLEYETDGSVGIDLRADIEDEVTIIPTERELIPTGLRLQVPDGFEVQIRPRSGLALKEGITVLNSPGTIDQDYRGDIGVILMNLGRVTYNVSPGERIAQMTLNPISRFKFVDKVLDETLRGDGGFGHTGKE